ncbi:MAG: class I SAM-dependent methyltransferase [Candidatus Hodarchaeota archaeon]
MTAILHDMKLNCPSCYSDGLKLESLNEDVRCSKCNAIFSFDHGFLDLLSEESPGMLPVSNPMKWNWLVKLYNSRLWRRSVLIKFSFGISFARELETITDAAKLQGHETILDLACGPGTYSLPLAKSLNGGFVVGVDLSIPMLKYAAKKASEEKQHNTLFIHVNAKNLPFSDCEFDVVNCCGALHLFRHFLPDLLSKISRILKPGGRFTIAAANTPNGGLGRRITSYSARKTGLKFFTPNELEAYLKEAGFIDISCHHAKRYWLIMSASSQMTF